MSYAELLVTSNFTFLTGASHPEELVEQADALGLAAIAITDTNSFAGVVRAHAAARHAKVKYIVGVRLLLEDGQDILAYPTDREAYGRLCRLLTIGKRRTVKGKCSLKIEDVLDWCDGSFLIALAISPKSTQQLADRFAQRMFIGLSPLYDGQDEERFAARAEFARKFGLPLVATGNVLLHKASRRPLADVLTCIRDRCTIDTIGKRAMLNAERRLKSPFEMYKLYKNNHDAIANTVVISSACRFSLSELKYEYPEEISDGKPPLYRLRELADEGLRERYPDGVPLNV